MSDEEQSVSSSTYSSDGEEAEEELELDEYGEAEPEAEGEGEGEAEGDDADADAEADADPDAEPDNEGEVEGADGEGEGEESDEDDEDVDASTESSDEEEEEELDADDAEGDDDLEDDGGDLEAALENMEAMDDEQQDEEMARARLEVPAPAEKQATATQLRRKLFCTPQPYPRSYAIDPICALPHPVATSCLASSVCMTYLATGSEDGFVRCYDFFAGVNGKTFLTAPQRHHCGIGEGTMKAGVLKMWWENYAPNANTTAMSLVGTGVGLGGSVKNENGGEDKSLSPVHSMIMQGDALWSLSGTATGHVNLTTIRHEPGKTHHTFSAHNKGPVSCLALTPDEHGFFSAGWDGDTKACQIVRVFGASQQRDTSSQVVSLGLRPQVPISQANAHNEVPNADLFSIGFDDGNGGILPSNSLRDPNDDGDSHSSSSDNSLFGDDDDDDDSGDDGDNSPKQSKTARRKLTGRSDRPNGIPSAASGSGRSSVTQSPDLLMTAYIDGQVLLWDRRASPQSKPLRLEMGEKSPPWCVSACWSANGHEVYAGRRIGTIDVWDIRQSGGYSNATGRPRLLKSLRNPASSGPVTCVAGFPDGHHLVWWVKGPRAPSALNEEKTLTCVAPTSKL
ncbi:Transcription factor spt8 [Tulasnella sp. 332]|nr:Transcription factor spt8 [Tulasnella sp. 332]